MKGDLVLSLRDESLVFQLVRSFIPQNRWYARHEVEIESVRCWRRKPAMDLVAVISAKSLAPREKEMARIHVDLRADMLESAEDMLSQAMFHATMRLMAELWQANQKAIRGRSRLSPHDDTQIN